MIVRIKTADKSWSSDDGKIEQFIVVTDDGATYKTYSKTIAMPGWEGEVEKYDKQGTSFLKQPAKFGGGTKSFKADPDKMEQDKLLAIATNLSIQRQVAMKGAVELIVAGKREYSGLALTFYDLMELLEKKHEAN